jgi:hypothetical protein
LRKDGQYRWFLIRYRPFRNEQGHVVRWYVAGPTLTTLRRLNKSSGKKSASYAELPMRFHKLLSCRTRTASRCMQTRPLSTTPVLVPRL